MSFTYVRPTIIGSLPKQLVTLGLIKEGELTKFTYDKVKDTFKKRIYFSEQLFLDNLQLVWDVIFDPSLTIGTKLVIEHVTEIIIIDYRDTLDILVDGEWKSYDIYIWEGTEKVGFNKPEIERALSDVPIELKRNSSEAGTSCYLSFYKYIGSPGIETKELVYDNDAKQYNVV